MTYAQLVLEYLKVLLSAPVIAGAAAIVLLVLFREDFKALLRRVAKIRLPGGTEVSTSQATKAEEAAESKPLDKPPLPADPPPQLPSGLAPNEIQEIRQLFDAERARAFLWEYRYLNYFLVYHTQLVLDWFASLPSATSISLFDSAWLPLIPSAEERRAVIDALQAHHLVQLHGDHVEVTPKGREYIAWRGPLSQPKA
ncbi:MAG: hypothetical protein H0X40_18165 [Chthoniobacterales bacterium]|nr:hypothetical protein [Chthoniobacterales bacterium]